MSHAGEDSEDDFDTFSSSIDAKALGNGIAEGSSSRISLSDHSLSKSDEVLDHLASSPTLSEKGKIIILAMNEDLIGSSRPVKSRPPAPKGTKRYLEGQRRFAFKREWNRLGLGTQLPPEELANQVALMRVPGMTDRAAGRLASRILSIYSLNGDYINKFNMRKVRISRFAFEVRKEMMKSLNTKTLNKEQNQMAIIEAIRRLDVSEQLPRNPGVSPSAKVRKINAERKLDEIEKFLQRHLKSKESDLFTILLDRLEVELREVTSKKIIKKPLQTMFSAI